MYIVRNLQQIRERKRRTLLQLRKESPLSLSFLLTNISLTYSSIEKGKDAPAIKKRVATPTVLWFRQYILDIFLNIEGLTCSSELLRDLCSLEAWKGGTAAEFPLLSWAVTFSCKLRRVFNFLF